MKNNVRATWHLNRDCNFRCSYCYVSKMREHGNQRGHGVEKDIQAFKKNKVNWDTILMSGGEPFIYPGYVTLCKKLTDFSNIEINTNCSTSNVYDFADTIDPKKVKEIHVSLHLGQRPKKQWKKLVNKVQYLKERKFPVWVSEVLHPDLVDVYVTAFDFFKTHDICIVPKVFEGYDGFRLYPALYKKRDRSLFIDYSKKCNVTPPPLLYGFLDWKGKVCSAGYNFMQIQYNGDAFRCQADKTKLGNLYEGDITLFDKPQRCTMDVCTCAYEGLHYAQGAPHIHKIPHVKTYAKKAGEYYLNTYIRR